MYGKLPRREAVRRIGRKKKPERGGEISDGVPKSYGVLIKRT